MTAAAGKRQRVSPHDDAYHFFNRNDADKEAQRKPHLEEAAMALLLLDVHSAPGKVTSLPSCLAHRRTGQKPCLGLQQLCKVAWLEPLHGCRQQCVIAAAPAGSPLRPTV